MSRKPLPQPITPELVAAARGWVSDCAWVESEDYGIDPADEYDDDAIVRGVDRHWAGGWAEFVRMHREDQGLPSVEFETHLEHQGDDDLEPEQ